jgi:hypothetical protein
MKKVIILLLVVSGGLNLVKGANLDVYSTTTPPVVDGVLNDPIWGHCHKATNFSLDIRSRREVRAQTVVKCVFTQQSIYFSFEFDEPLTDRIVAQCSLRDEDLYQYDDSGEVFLDVNYDRRTYFQFLFNSIGVVADGLQPGNDWSYNPNWTIATKVNPDQGNWVAEMEIPFVELGLTGAPSTGTMWGVNFARNRYTIRPVEHSSWAGIKGDWGRPEDFYTITFHFQAIDRINDVSKQVILNYPNPIFNIGSLLKQFNQGEMKIYNILGQLVKEVEGINSGIYFIQKKQRKITSHIIIK